MLDRIYTKKTILGQAPGSGLTGLIFETPNRQFITVLLSHHHISSSQTLQ